MDPVAAVPAPFGPLRFILSRAKSSPSPFSQPEILVDQHHFYRSLGVGFSVMVQVLQIRPGLLHASQ